MNSFDLDLGLERYDKDELSELYLSGGVKIEAGGKVITSFNFNDNGYLGTYIIIIWKNIATNAAKLSKKNEITFEVMTEGWDPEYKVEKIGNKRLKISMTEDSATWSDDIEVPQYCQNGVETDAYEFFESIIESGEALIKLLEKMDSRSSTVSNVVDLLEKLNQGKEEYEN